MKIKLATQEQLENVKSETFENMLKKQDKLTAGDNIDITDDTISAVDTTYDDSGIKADIATKQDKLTAGDNITIDPATNTISGTAQYDDTQIKADVDTKQDKLTAGDNIDITNDTISATDTITTINGKSGAISKADITALGIPSQDTVYKKPSSEPISYIQGLQAELDSKIERASRSATFVIANHDSSENSKDGADYVVGIDDEFPDVLESCIGKLPSYGGKIVLTEGNFIVPESKNISIDRPGVTIEGYGRDVTKIKKLGGSGSLIGINSDCCSVDSCTILNAEGLGIFIRGNRTCIRNCTILANTNSINTLEGITDLTICDCEIETIEGYPAVVFKGSYLKMLACKVKCLLGNPIWLQEMSKNGMVILCSFEGESYSSVFRGDNHVIMGNSFTEAEIESKSAINSLISNNLMISV